MNKKLILPVALAASAISVASMVAQAGGVEAPVNPYAGFYAGLNVGFADGMFNGHRPDEFGLSYNDNDIQAIGGGQIGYNMLSENETFLYGIEGDVSYTDLNVTTRDHEVITVAGIEAAEVNGKAKAQTDWLGTVRLRGGILNHNTLFYATGGVAIGATCAKLKFSGEDLANPSVYAKGFDSSNTSVGWTAGGGFEHAFSVMGGQHNLSLRGQVLYVDLGDESHNVSYTSPDPDSTGITKEKVKIETKEIITTLGLNYLFQS